MKTRISAMVCLLCVLGDSDLTRADDPYSHGSPIPMPYRLIFRPCPPGRSSPIFLLWPAWQFR